MRAFLITSLLFCIALISVTSSKANDQPASDTKNQAPEVVVDKYPWEENQNCPFDDYGATGIPSSVMAIMKKLSLTHRITQGINYAAKASNYHGPDTVENGVDVSFAIDISVKCLKDNEIIALLEILAQNDIVAWYRLRGVDGWPEDKEKKYLNHIHAVYVKGTLKPQLSAQVQNWLNGRNGLFTDLPYTYWTPSESVKDKIRDLL